MTSDLTRRAVVLAATFPLGLAAGPLSPAQGSHRMKIKIAFNGQSMVAALEENPSARDLVTMLPQKSLTIEDYGSNEKISYLPRKLTEVGSAPFENEQPGDVCYFAPWGNLALFYAGYRWSRGLIRLGRIEGSFQPLLTRGEFPLVIQAAG